MTLTYYTFEIIVQNVKFLENVCDFTYTIFILHAENTCLRALSATVENLGSKFDIYNNTFEDCFICIAMVYEKNDGFN